MGTVATNLFFGENPNLPNIMKDNLPALEGSTSSEVFAKHLNALHAARKIFIQTVKTLSPFSNICSDALTLFLSALLILSSASKSSSYPFLSF